MQQLLRAYSATLTSKDRYRVSINDWYLTLIIDIQSVRCYHIDSSDEMALACIELMKGLGVK